MTLVLSMNPFLDPEGDPPPYRPIWETERLTKTSLTNAVPPCSSEEHVTQGTDTSTDVHSVICLDLIQLATAA